MSIGTTITAPSPARTAFSPACSSPLNPSHNHLNRPQSTTSSNNRTHLSNLDRLLLKQQEPPPPQCSRSSIKENLMDNSNSTGNDNSSVDNSNGGGGLFNALNLNTIIPSLRNPATEAMSPNSLTKLQRLLSSPHPSPKNSIASQWRLYHGSDNWANLLDPLDENLRRELVRYGDLVQAAYHVFHSNPGAPPSRNRHIILPDRNYRVTRSLYATSSVELPKWLDGVAPWMTQRSSWIGYVAVCDNQQEINRMGHRDIVISLRGTSTCMEWAENVRAGLVPLTNGFVSESADKSDCTPKVANGFYSLYKTPGEHVLSLSEIVLSEVRRLVELYKGEELSITVTGHSLGAALALFVADDIAMQLPHLPPVAVFSFGGPRAGNQAFVDRLDRSGVKVLRVVNANDVITRLPAVVPYVLEGYMHVGSELKVDSKASPYLRPDADPNCCHDLESYLHLVDGYMGSDCPFRSDAKRSLAKLLDQQRPNLKRLYVNHAEMLVGGLNRFEPGVLASPSHANGYLASPSA